MKPLYNTGLLSLILFGFNAAMVTAQSNVITSSWNQNESIFTIDPVKDSVLLGTGLLLNGVNFVIESTSEEPPSYPVEKADSNFINGFDRYFLFPYSEGRDKLSSILAYSTLLAPLLLVSTPPSEWFPVGVMYAETILFSHGLKELGKNLISRERPYRYFDDYPEDDAADGDYRRSFPSGHSTLAFNAASFCSFVFATYYPDSVWKIPVQSCIWTLAFTSAVLRITSGNHFPGDVAAGAAIGILSGYLIPRLHLSIDRETRKENTGTIQTRLSIMACGIQIELSY